MPDSPFIGPTHPLKSRSTSIARAVNLMPVRQEAGNERSSWVFKDLPGLVEFGTNPYVPPVTHDDVLLLMHFDQAAPFLEQRGRAVTNNGAVGVYVPTVMGQESYKFGPAAGGFPNVSAGYTDWLSAPSTALLEWGASMFVWDVWIPSVPSTAHPNIIFAVSVSDASIYPVVQLEGSGEGGVFGFKFTARPDQDRFTGGGAWVSASIPTDNNKNFHHVRCGRVDATTIGISIDGAAPTLATISSSYTFTPPAATSKVFIGWGVGGDTSIYVWKGGMDELVCRAAAMDSVAFTPPTVPYVYP